MRGAPARGWVLGRSCAHNLEVHAFKQATCLLCRPASAPANVGTSEPAAPQVRRARRHKPAATKEAS
jgi:hypothetical protein